MCPDNPKMCDNNSDPNTEEDSDSSIVSVSDTEDEEEPQDSPDVIMIEDEEEDEVIKAIRRASNKKSDKPPSIHLEDDITKISFHPHEDIIAIADIVGNCSLFKYSNESNDLLGLLELHNTSCRDIDFSKDGKLLFSVSTDKVITLSDVETQKLTRFYDNAHESDINCVSVLDENLFATGDDDGTVKLWDFRDSSKEQIYKAKRNEDYISAIITNEDKKYVLCSSGDGSITSFDLQNRKFHMQSEEYDDDLTCLGIFKHDTKLVSGTSTGRLLLFNWGEFGLHSDIFPGPKTSVNSMIPITENIVVTACDDGILRATHLFPQRHLGIVGQHNLAVENVDICNDGRFIASNSHENDVHFWNIQYFEDFDKVSKKHKKYEKKGELKNNLPSSKFGNASDFFTDLVSDD